MAHIKNYETKNLVFRFPIYFLIQTLKGIVFPFYNEISILLKNFFPKIKIYRSFGKTEQRTWYLAFFKGYWLFLKNLRSVFIERGIVQKIRIVPDKKIFLNTQEKNARSLLRFLRIGL